jgi:cellulose 1,4-beta-cellobiosidase
VVTQFITDDGTSSGTLSEIKRFYVQNNVVYPQPNADVAGITGNVIDAAFCTAELSVFQETTSFTNHGGLGAVSKALSAGMVLVMSLWDDYYANMLWLESDYPTNETASTPGLARGTCSTSSGVPATIESQDSSAYVAYSDIKVGPIGSTFNSGSPGGGSSSSSSSTLPTSTTSSPSGSSTGVAHWGQCGGQGYTGSTTCASPYTCQEQNPYYSQCL